MKSEDFRRLWTTHHVRHHPYGQKLFRHPLVGELTFPSRSCPPPEGHEQSNVVYHAEPGAPSADALLLASRGADARRWSHLAGRRHAQPRAIAAGHPWPLNGHWMTVDS